MTEPVPRVVIPCRNSDRTIGACLEALFASRNIDFEVVVVDDGGNATLQSLQDRYRFTLRSTGGGKGAGAARNAGAAGYEDGILIFLDADVILEAEALEKLVAPIRNGAAEATVGAYSTDVGERTTAEAYKQLYLAHRYSKRDGYLSDTFWTAIGAVRVAAFRSAGKFPEAWPWAGPEDVELGIALCRNGARILAVPQARGRHLAAMSVAGLLWNDLRKGTEDIYVHWTRAVPLTHNRHASTRDILAVGLSVAASTLALLGRRPAAAATVAAYFIVRRDLLAAFRGRTFAAAVPLTFLLDLTRAAAVVAGTAAALTAPRGSS